MAAVMIRFALLTFLAASSVAAHVASPARTASAHMASPASIACARALPYPMLRGRASALRSAPVAYEGEKYSRETRIKEELASPFRGFRFFIYGGMILGGSSSGYIALTGLLAALTGRQGVVSMDQFKINAAVNLGVIALAGLGLANDLRLRTENLDRIAALLDAEKKERRAGIKTVDDDTDIFVGK